MMICDAFSPRISRIGNYNCRTVLSNTGSTFLFIYFSIINGLGYDIYLTYSSYLFVITSSCSNGREDDKFQLIRSIFSIDLANS